MAVSCRHTISLGSHKFYVLPLVTGGVFPNLLKSIHKICLHRNQLHGVLTVKEGVGLFKFHKRRNLVSLKLSAIWSNLSLHHSCLLLPKKTFCIQFDQVENIHGHLFEKIFLVCFSPLSPQAEQKEDDEHFANHLQMYVSRTFTKAKKSVICAEYPMSSKFHLSKWKTYFSQFIDKYLKIKSLKAWFVSQASREYFGVESTTKMN